MSIDILNQMIANSAREQLTKEYSKYNVRLAEPNESDSFVDVKGLPPDAVVVKIDNFPAPVNFFVSENGLCKRADYAIFTDTTSKKRILIIEIKRGKKDRTHLVQQFKGAICVLSYCKEIASRFFNCNSFLEDYEIRYVSFCKTSIRKQKTRLQKPQQLNDQPDSFWKINQPTYIEFNHLVGS